MMKFKVCDTAITISYPAVAFICISLFTMGRSSHLLLFSLAASAFHEAGHIFFICKYKGKPESINVKLGEIAINSNITTVTYAQEILIVIAGVLVNFTLAVVCLFLQYLSGCTHCFDFAVCNLVIGLFNLLPVKSFDGSQLLELILIHKFSLSTSEKIINIITAVVIVPVTTAGFCVLFKTGFNYSMLIMAVYFIVLILSKEMR